MSCLIRLLLLVSVALEVSCMTIPRSNKPIAERAKTKYIGPGPVATTTPMPCKDKRAEPSDLYPIESIYPTETTSGLPTTTSNDFTIEPSDLYPTESIYPIETTSGLLPTTSDDVATPPGATQTTSSSSLPAAPPPCGCPTTEVPNPPYPTIIPDNPSNDLCSYPPIVSTSSAVTSSSGYIGTLSPELPIYTTSSSGYNPTVGPNPPIYTTSSSAGDTPPATTSCAGKDC